MLVKTREMEVGEEVREKKRKRKRKKKKVLCSLSLFFLSLVSSLLVSSCIQEIATEEGEIQKAGVTGQFTSRDPWMHLKS